jgi:hypothetical protein
MIRFYFFVLIRVSWCYFVANCIYIFLFVAKTFLT